MTDLDPLAEPAVREWLALADVVDAAETWNHASSLFQRAVDADGWARSLRAAREPLGKVEERTLRSSRGAAELPGAPDGEYAIFEFATRFEHKRSAIETVTAMRDTDGLGRVGGYFIR